MVHTRGVPNGCASFYLKSGEPYATYSAVPQPFKQYNGAYSFRGLSRVASSCCLLYMVGRGLLFQVVFHLVTVDSESVVGIKHSDSGVVIGYQVDKLTHFWSAEYFIAQPHIYPGFMGKVFTLTHFPVDQAVRVIPFWTRQWRTLSIFWILFSWTPLTH